MRADTYRPAWRAAGGSVRQGARSMDVRADTYRPAWRAAGGAECWRQSDHSERRPSADRCSAPGPRSPPSWCELCHTTHTERGGDSQAVESRAALATHRDRRPPPPPPPAPAARSAQLLSASGFATYLRTTCGRQENRARPRPAPDLSRLFVNIPLVNRLSRPDQKRRTATGRAGGGGGRKSAKQQHGITNEIIT